MKIRRTKKTIEFDHPFTLHGYKETLPSGRYEMETEEEWIEGLSFVAFKRKQVILHLQRDAQRPGISEILTLKDPRELDAALARDAKLGHNANAPSGKCAGVIGKTSEAG